jgi:hypothetical protein
MTLYDLLTAYCSENNIPIPPKEERGIIGRLVGREFKTFFPDVNLPKVQGAEIVWVKSYPESFSDNMKDVIKHFFENRESILQNLENITPKAFKKFNFNVVPECSDAFESVLIRKNIPYIINFRTPNTVQFIITYTDPTHLIFLGMSFESDLKKGGLRFLNNKKEDNSLSEQKAVKKQRTRKPVPVYTTKK